MFAQIACNAYYWPIQEAHLLRLAERQAQRDEELAEARRRASELEAEVSDLTREMELRQEQEAALKEVSVFGGSATLTYFYG